MVKAKVKLGMSKSEYAAHRGCSPGYVTRLAQDGRLCYLADGSIDAKASDARVAETGRVDRQGVREHHAATRGTVAQVSPAASPEASGNTVYNRARADKETELALIAKMRREEAEGRLVDADQVRAVIFERARVARNALQALPEQLAGRLAAEADVRRVHELLEQEIRRICEELGRPVLPDNHH